MSVMDETNKKMSSAVEHLKEELRGLRTGRANAAMVEKVGVNVYGTQMRLKDMASISVSEGRQLMISPYDMNNLQAIAKGIEAANLGFKIVVEAALIRVIVPEMDASMRSELVKLAKQKCEKTKVTIRNIRRDSNESVKKQKSSGEIPEDMLKKYEKQIQEYTDKFCKLADDVTAQKEKEITTI